MSPLDISQSIPMASDAESDVENQQPARRMAFRPPDDGLANTPMDRPDHACDPARSASGEYEPERAALFIAARW